MCHPDLAVSVLSRFSLVQKHTVEFNQLAMANSEGSEAMLNRVMTKDNIGVAVLLELRKEMMEQSGLFSFSLFFSLHYSCALNLYGFLTRKYKMFTEYIKIVFNLNFSHQYIIATLC